MGQLHGNLPETEFLFSSSFTEADWLEAVNLYSPSQFSVGRRKAVATLTAYIEDFNKLKACIHWLRGYSWVDSDKNLRRVRPARHPIWYNLVCTEILEVTGITFDSKQEVVVEGMDLPFALYEKFKITASFNTVPWLIYEDSEVETEDERWTTFSPKPYVDLYEIPSGQVKFNAPGEAWHTTPVIAPILVRSQKSLYELKWFDVPVEFIRDADGALPKLDAAIGKVSADTFAGKEIGEWLIDDIDVDIQNDPIVGDMLGTPGRMADVTFKMKLWQPVNANTTSTVHGWNLELAVNGKAYPTTNVVTGTTATKFESVTVASLFTHWQV